MRRFTVIALIILNILCPLKTVISGNNLRLKDLYYENSLGEKGITHFYYSLENKNYKAKWELLDGRRYSINYHFLNENGNLVRKYREFSDSITSNNFYKYDKEENLIEDYFERSDGVKGIVWYKYQEGKKIEAECRGLNGWFFGFIKYEYSEDILIKGIIQKEGKEIGFIDYTYDECGNLTAEYWDFGKWNQTFTYEYETIPDIEPDFYAYSSPLLNATKEFLIEKEEYDWNNEQGGPSMYEYEKNKLHKKVYKYDSLETITTYEYDENGLLMKSFRNYSDGRRAEFSYHYNKNIQLVRRLFHKNNGFFGSESYEYNVKGELIVAEWNNYDTWLTGNITFKYENGTLLSGKFIADQYSADLVFTLDKDKNVTKIKWDFSFGKTQTYWFKYQKL